MPGQIPAVKLATLTYRSKASSEISREGLESILDVARSRNSAVSVTGLLVYDNGQIFQWLEGPEDSVASIWDSIRQDRRHTEIEVLQYSTSAVRVFGDWDMKLATKQLKYPLDLSESDSMPFGMMTPVLPAASRSWQAPLARDSVVRPISRRRMLPIAHPRAVELARLLLAVDSAAAFGLFDSLTVESGSMGACCASVSEPAARALGEIWAADDCTEVDVVLGLGRLRSAIRRLDLGSKDQAGGGPLMKSVLVVPQPGETHVIGAALDAEVLCRDGFQPTCEFPLTDADLDQMVGKKWFDAVDLSLSPAFRREGSLPRMARTIASARAASLNPELIVVVGGRIFYDNGADAASVGADEAHSSALQAPHSIRSASSH